MEQKQTGAQDTRNTGLLTALFSIVIIYTAVFVCVLVLVLALRKPASPPLDQITTPAVTDGEPTEAPTGPSGPALPVFAPLSPAKQLQATANTKTVTTEIVSKYGILVDAESGEILAGKGVDVRFNPASLTKIMTLLVACERLNTYDLEEDLVFTKEISDYVRPVSGPYKGTDCYWKDIGDGATLLTQLYGVGVESSADCTMMVVHYLVQKELAGPVTPAESEAQFVQWMNETAAEMGLVNTHFDNVIGHESEKNYSTASEMAAILLRALECQLVKDILSVRSQRFEAAFGYDSAGNFLNYGITFYSTLFNANPQRSSREKAYEEKYGKFELENGTLGGGKTGSLKYGADWNYSLATFATVNGKTYIVVTGETADKAGVLKDAKTLYDSVGQ